MSEALVSVLIALADDELIIGHRHSEWTGFAPHIEEDVAFSSIAQDEIGHAAALYELAAAPTGRDADRLAFGREPGEYRHAVLCERPNRDWAYTLARHWLYDTAEDVRLDSLVSSSHRPLAALAVKLQREERYHMLHGDAWVERIAHGPLEGRSKLVDALAEALGESRGLFEPFEGEDDALAEGWLPETSSVLLDRFVKRATGALDELGLPTGLLRSLDESAEFVASSSGDLILERSAGEDEHRTARAGEDGLRRRPAEGYATVAGRPSAPAEHSGGRTGRHSEDFAALWDEMTSTYRASPGASW